MTSVVFDPDARAEFLDAVRYYEERQKGLGLRYRIAVEIAVKQLSENPFLYRTITSPFRRYLLSKFPYSIIYSIEPDYIYIIALAHNKRKPGYWLKRRSGSGKE
ncbi:MAG: type II toxin-antitoxin system RelE/ParE family toxin [Chlorobaculum sp.]|nr:type II toxin-antitoxin system RelE/ParE family toxin [Chlorobaculum sp.]